MYSVGGNLCESISKNDTPWWPLVESFNKTSCPIAAVSKDIIYSPYFLKIKYP